MHSNITATVIFVTLRKTKTIQMPATAALNKIPLGREMQSIAQGCDWTKIIKQEIIRPVGGGWCVTLLL